MAGVSGLLMKIKARSKVERHASKGELEIAHPFEQPVVPKEEDVTEAEATNHFLLLELGGVVGADHMAAPAASPVDPETAQRKRHGFILEELLETEEDYLRDMEMIVELFLVPLRLNKVVSKQEGDNVFLNLPHLIPSNHDLLDKLRVESSKPIEEQRVGRVFTEFFASGAMREYTQYASQSVSSGHTLLSLSKANSQWNKFLEETYRNPQLRDLKLDTYLIKPVQRVCRYPLLLNELRQATPVSCQDYADLTAAGQSMSIAIKVINEKRGESETLHHVVQLENSLRNLPANLKLVVPGRTFVREALMEKVRKGRRHEQCMVWCFSDCLVFGKTQGKSLYFKGVVFFNNALLQGLPDNAAKDVEHAFELIMFPAKESIVFCCSSLVQKQEWMHEISVIVERNLEEGAEKHKQARANVVPLPQTMVADETETLNDLDNGVGGNVESSSPVAEEEKTATRQSQVSWETMTSGGPRKKVPIKGSDGSGKTTLMKGSVRVKGAELSARVIKLRDEMRNPNNGLELSTVAGKSEHESVFSGRAAIDWTLKRFKLDEEDAKDSAMELMIGLMRSGVIVPVLGTPAENFLCSFTSYYAFAGVRRPK